MPYLVRALDPDVQHGGRRAADGSGADRDSPATGTLIGSAGGKERGVPISQQIADSNQNNRNQQEKLFHRRISWGSKPDQRGG